MKKALNQTNNYWISITKILGAVLVVALLVFVVLQFRSTWQGPVIHLRYPVAGQSLYSSIVVVSGTTKNIAQLKVSGSPVPIQLTDNSFVTEIAVPEGVSNITLDGYTRSGRHTRTNIPVLYNPRAATSHQLSPTLELLQEYGPTEIPFRPTSDLLDELEPIES